MEWLTVEHAELGRSLAFFLLACANMWLLYSWMMMQRRLHKVLDLNMEALKLMHEAAQIAIAGGGMKIMEATCGDEVTLQSDSGKTITMAMRKPGKLR